MDAWGIREWGTLVLAAIAAGGVITSPIVYWLRTIFAEKSELATTVAAHEKRLADLDARVGGQMLLFSERWGAIDTRLAKIEGSLEHLPTKEGLHNVALSIAALSGSIGKIEERINGIDGSTRRLERVSDPMESHLMTSGKAA